MKLYKKFVNWLYKVRCTIALWGATFILAREREIQKQHKWYKPRRWIPTKPHAQALFTKVAATVALKTGTYKKYPEC